MARPKRITIERNQLYHLYFYDDLFFVDYYGDFAAGYETEGAAREAIDYHFN